MIRSECKGGARSPNPGSLGSDKLWFIKGGKCWRQLGGGGNEALPADSRSVAICHFSLRIQKLPRLLVTSSDGHLYIYNLDPQDGGECVLIKTHR